MSRPESRQAGIYPPNTGGDVRKAGCFLISSAARCMVGPKIGTLLRIRLIEVSNQSSLRRLAALFRAPRPG